MPLDRRYVASPIGRPVRNSERRLRALLQSEGPPATKVEYGSGYLLTHEAIDDPIARIVSAVRSFG